MIIGLPKEIKTDESRIALLPSGVFNLVSAGHEVVVEKGAGEISGFPDRDFEEAGAKLMESSAQVYDRGDLIVKVKQVLPQEYDALREGQILLGYYMVQEDADLTRLLLEKKVIVYTYENARDARGDFPLLAPMSEMTGRMALIMGAFYLFNTQGGQGILLGGHPGVEAAEVTILGAGNAGMAALGYAVGLQARVTLMDRNIHKLKAAEEAYPGIRTFLVSPFTLRQVLGETDLLINALKYREGPRLISRDMLKLMRPGSLIVDGDGEPSHIETTRVTSYGDPIYQVDGIRHLAIPNVPSGAARTASAALANAVYPRLALLADKGWVAATKEDPSLHSSLTVAKGSLCLEMAARAHGMDYTPVEEVLVRLG